MARYRKIDPRIWNDAKFRSMSDNAKLVFFMLLTHPGMTALGAMRATLSGLSEELGWKAKDFREAFTEALTKGMAEHDEKACLVSLPNFLRYNAPESPNVVKAWVGALDLLPECELKSKVIQRAKDYTKALPEAFAKALPEAFAKSMPYQEPEQEPEQDSTRKRATLGVDDLVSRGVDQQTAKDWLTVRKAKRAPLTESALADVEREARKAGMTLAEAIAVCAKRSWQGFEAAWLQGKGAAPSRVEVDA